MRNHNDYYRYYLQNGEHDQPGPEGYQWIGKNVDIQLNNGIKYCDVRFINVETYPGPPVVYIWVFDDYRNGGAPIRNRLNSHDVLIINQSGTICGSPSGPSGPSGPGGCQWRWVPPFGWICI